MTKHVLISTVVSKWIEVPDNVDPEDYLFENDGLFDGIDLDTFDATDFEVVEVEGEDDDEDEEDDEEDDSEI